MNTLARRRPRDPFAAWRPGDVLFTLFGLAIAGMAFFVMVMVFGDIAEQRVYERTHQCVASHEESSMMMIPNGSGGFLYIPTSDTVCDRWEPRQ